MVVAQKEHLDEQREAESGDQEQPHEEPLYALIHELRLPYAFVLELDVLLHRDASSGLSHGGVPRGGR